MSAENLNYYIDKYCLYRNRKNESNKIKLKFVINEQDFNVPIYIFSKEFDSKGIDKSNTEIFIDDIKQEYIDFFKFEKEGTYDIEIIFKFSLTDCSFMFSKCKNIKSIDLSSFDSENVKNMKYMFSRCENLESINLSSFNTEKVNNMESMFANCKGLKNIDLSSFDTKNVIYMQSMFEQCENLECIDISSFYTKRLRI
jgi:surface protein